MKNPEVGSPPGAGLEEDEDADYPERLQQEFRGRRFVREEVRLLDFEGAEFILVGAVKNPERAYSPSRRSLETNAMPVFSAR